MGSYDVVSVENENVQMRLTLRQDILDRVPSCQLTFSQVEVMNMVSQVMICLLCVWVGCDGSDASLCWVSLVLFFLHSIFAL